jgi:hypothetical protein
MRPAVKFRKIFAKLVIQTRLTSLAQEKEPKGRKLLADGPNAHPNARSET